MGSAIAGSACDGRMNQYRNFVWKQAICASNAAALAYARIRAASRSVRWWSLISESAIRFRAPAVNGAAEKFQNCAIASCSPVLVSEIVRTSARAAANSAEPNAGGGGELRSLTVFMKNGRAPYSERTIGAPLDH